MLKDPEQVEEILVTVYDINNSEQPNRNCQEKLLFWLLYNGLALDKIVSLKKNDLDNLDIIIKAPILSSEDDIVSVWKSYSAITRIEKGAGRYNRSGVVYYNLVESDLLFRPISGNREHNNKFGLPEIRAVVKKILDAYFEVTSKRYTLSIDELRLSGIFYKLYLKELGGYDISFELMNSYVYVGNEECKNVNARMRRYMIDYRDWKDAFGF